jgi:hypothetical protein
MSQMHLVPTFTSYVRGEVLTEVSAKSSVSRLRTPYNPVSTGHYTPEKKNYFSQHITRKK